MRHGGTLPATQTSHCPGAFVVPIIPGCPPTGRNTWQSHRFFCARRTCSDALLRQSVIPAVQHGAPRHPTLWSSSSIHPHCPLRHIPRGFLPRKTENVTGRDSRSSALARQPLIFPESRIRSRHTACNQASSYSVINSGTPIAFIH